ncbi:hypothetical protein [Lactobacillus brevis] [Lactiplantibacillus mudanjiangensis]|uniref:phage baseplate plug family protein n=1 Tax=Lactiplantibacillus mudanjiangensis TaxID=1296538 RepID=UPI001014DD71|nr:hypothetical protein [Lactiplantibacillus mudanjiangensis]VDG32888.1 hypothetical protein [Lactobacillus brevis] [Lactiplantibacillus mudanjiangensis]
MALRDEIPISADDIGQTFEIDLENGSYNVTLQYNEVAELFTVDLVSVDDDTHQILGEPLILDHPLWGWCPYPWLPPERLVPMDESGQETEINLDNLGQTVKLLDDSLGDDSDDDD